MVAKKWDYGDAGDRFAVKPGDVWQVGQHLLACGDLETGAPQAFFAMHGPPVLVYTDPPWNAGNARSFRTKANSGTPEIETRPVNFAQLLDRVVEVAREARQLVYVEMGNATVELLRERIRASHGHPLATSAITYYGKKPCALVCATWAASPPPGFAPPMPPAGMDDEDTPEWVIARASKPGDLVFDPCTGRGLTAVSCAQLGRRFIGTELNPRRLAVAIDKLAAMGLPAQRIGSL